MLKVSSGPAALPHNRRRALGLSRDDCVQRFLGCERPVDEDCFKKAAWPDQAAYMKEEQRRFEILDAHWDLPIKSVELDTK